MAKQSLSRSRDATIRSPVWSDNHESGTERSETDRHTPEPFPGHHLPRRVALAHIAKILIEFANPIDLPHKSTKVALYNYGTNGRSREQTPASNHSALTTIKSIP
jgi:hypothetical protein